MAESQSMTSAGVVAKALIDEHSDFLRESVAMIATEIMARSAPAGARSQRDARPTQRLPTQALGDQGR
jgi:hypothetical protein